MKPTHPDAIRMVNLAFEAEVLARKLTREAGLMSAKLEGHYCYQAAHAIQNATHELLVHAAITDLNSGAAA